MKRIENEAHLNANVGYVTYMGDKNEGFSERIVMKGKVCEIKPCRAGNHGD